MASARELLEQADALMRRNRTGVVDTEIPELTDMVAMVALTPAAMGVSPGTAAPVVLDDVPELTEAVEEIEIESIVELPEDLDESSGLLCYDHGELSVVGRGPDSVATSIAARNRNGAPAVECESSAPSIVAKPVGVAMPTPKVTSFAKSLPSKVPFVAEALAPRIVPVAEPPLPPTPRVIVPADAVPQVSAVSAATPELPAFVAAAREAPASAAADSSAGTTDEWARWEALAEEIRMQVLQRIDIFTDTRLRDQLSAQLQPIVDRASAEMVSTINAHVGGLLRAYIAEAIEREIEKWRGPPR